MKVVLLFPKYYTLLNTFKKGLLPFCSKIFDIDYFDYTPVWKRKVNTQVFRLPNNIRTKWDKQYFRSINKKYIDEIGTIEPDYIFIYNNQGLLPDTLEILKRKSKIIFFLGDSPFYTFTNGENLRILSYADLIISPDSFWKEQLEILGLKNIHFDLIGFDESTNYKLQPSEDMISKYSCDILFIGLNYVDSWGYKRALFLSKFAEFDLRIHGNSLWLRWFEIFPELKEKFTMKGQYSEEFVNLLMNCAKLYPVDANPGLLNGVHLRIFNNIASGLLPLVEYRKDVETIFKKHGLPIIKNYDKAADMARYYLNNENERIEIIKNLRSYVQLNYSPEKSIGRILDLLR